MIGGGIHFIFDDRDRETRCLVEAIMRPDTNLNVLTVSSGAGFVFTLSRPDGLVDAAGEPFLRNTEFTKSGEKMRAVSKLSDGLVVTEIVIKFMIRDDSPLAAPLSNLMIAGGPAAGYRKQLVDLTEIHAEILQHITMYNAFNSGDSQIIPSLIGDAIELTHADILTVLDALTRKSVTTGRAKSIAVFEYLSQQLKPNPLRRVVGLFIEKVGHDDPKGEYSVVGHVDPLPYPEVIENAAIAACTTQIMIAGSVKKILVDAHEGNWFIDYKRPKKFFAIDFGRLLDLVDRTELKRLYTVYHDKYTNPQFPILPTQIMPSNCVFFPPAEFDTQFDATKTSLSDLNTKTYTRAQVNVRRADVHRCLTMIAILDNIYVDYYYGLDGTWNQPQMRWAYQIVWGYPEFLDDHDKTPLMLLPGLTTNYNAFMNATSVHGLDVVRVNSMYDRICELRTTITDNTETRPKRPIRMPGPQWLIRWSSIIAGPAGASRPSMKRLLFGATLVGVAALAAYAANFTSRGGNRTSKRKLSVKNKNKNKTLKRN